MVLLHCDHTQLVDTGVFFAFFFSGGQGSQQDASDGQRSLHSSAADRQQHLVAQVVFSTWLQHDNIVDVWYRCSTCSSWELYRNKHSLNCVFDVLNACTDIQYTYERTCVLGWMLFSPMLDMILPISRVVIPAPFYVSAFPHCGFKRFCQKFMLILHA